MLSRFEQIEMYLLRQGHLFIPRQCRCAAYWWSRPISLQQQHYSGLEPNRRSAWKPRWSCDHSNLEVNKPCSSLGLRVRYNSWDDVSVVTAVAEEVFYNMMEISGRKTSGQICVKQVDSSSQWMHNAWALTHTHTQTSQFMHHTSRCIMKCDISSKGANGV